MPRHQLDAEGIADLTEELVPTAEDGQFLVVALERDRDFGHAQPFQDPAIARELSRRHATKCQAGRRNNSL